MENCGVNILLICRILIDNGESAAIFLANKHICGVNARAAMRNVLDKSEA
jgi:hypothetical protein